MTSHAKFKCAICNTSMAPHRVIDFHKTLCVSCELAEVQLDILYQAITPKQLWDNLQKGCKCKKII